MHWLLEQEQVFFGDVIDVDVNAGDAGDRVGAAADDPGVGGEDGVSDDDGGGGDESSRLMSRDFSLVSLSFPRKSSGADSSSSIA